jgi:wyosine [tRNA(Phe)-imidazoG37] synthetase (radical SAM superfamily)
VFTNASLLWNSNVKERLLFADYVSVKIDTVTEGTWKRINRPHVRLKLNTILNGISDFSETYQGELTTETMLVKNFNDNINEIEQVGSFLKKIKRNKSYFTIPIRPPAEQYAILPDESTLIKLSSYIKENIKDAETLFYPESNNFKAAGKIEDEILGIISVHPMREDSIIKLIKEMGGREEILNNMIKYKQVCKFNYQNTNFYSANSAN